MSVSSILKDRFAQGWFCLIETILYENKKHLLRMIFRRWVGIFPALAYLGLWSLSWSQSTTSDQGLTKHLSSHPGIFWAGRWRFRWLGGNLHTLLEITWLKLITDQLYSQCLLSVMKLYFFPPKFWDIYVWNKYLSKNLAFSHLYI